MDHQSALIGNGITRIRSNHRLYRLHQFYWCVCGNSLSSFSNYTNVVDGTHVKIIRTTKAAIIVLIYFK